MSTELVVFCRVFCTEASEELVERFKEWGIVMCNYSESLGFQNCINRLMRLLLLVFSLLSVSVEPGARDSIESLLFSP